MSRKRILVVDDDKDILFLLALSVKNLGPEYEVSTAQAGPEALRQIQKQSFDLVITDYMMPGMSGLQLVEEMRRISPDTRVVLMSAYDTAQVRARVEETAVSGYVGKPFTVPEILDVVKRLVAQSPDEEEAAQAGLPDVSHDAGEHVRWLLNQAGAYYVLVVTSEGHPLYVEEGQVSDSKAARVGAFVARNFMAVAELAHLLEDTESAFNAIYHEGSKYHIYACGVSGDYLLAVVFGTAGKPGTVWYYAKQTAAALAPLLEPASAGAITGPAEDSMEADFDDLLGDET